MPHTFLFLHDFFINLVPNGWAPPVSSTNTYLPALDLLDIIIEIIAISADLVILN